MDVFDSDNSLEVSRTAVGEPALLGLLRVYKEYCPDVIVSQPAAGRFTGFKVKLILKFVEVLTHLLNGCSTQI